MFSRRQEATGPGKTGDDGGLDTESAVKVDIATEVAIDGAKVKAEERRLLRKFDWLLLPPLTVMSAPITTQLCHEDIDPLLSRYLCNALDKGNVGNAKTDGWDTVCRTLLLL